MAAKTRCSVAPVVGLVVVVAVVKVTRTVTLAVKEMMRVLYHLCCDPDPAYYALYSITEFFCLLNQIRGILTAVIIDMIVLTVD